MKILVTNNTLGSPGGSETYAYALISELHNRGIDVEALTASSVGIIATKLTEKGIKISRGAAKERSYDLILASHLSSHPIINNLQGKKIQTCHGPMHHLEQPMSGIDGYVSVSEEVQAHLQSKNIQSSVIYNGVDVDRFSPKKPIGDSVKSVLSLSQHGPFNTFLKKMFEKRGIAFKSLNKFASPVFNVEDYINEADLVISIGRGVYEAMSCGRPVLCLDNRQYMGAIPTGEGLLTENNMTECLKNNCTGRRYKISFNEQSIIQEIEKYNPSIGEWARQFVLNNLAISKQVDKYLSLK